MGYTLPKDILSKSTVEGIVEQAIATGTSSHRNACVLIKLKDSTQWYRIENTIRLDQGEKVKIYYTPPEKSHRSEQGADAIVRALEILDGEGKAKFTFVYSDSRLEQINR
jgi:hypothetical protein